MRTRYVLAALVLTLHASCIDSARAQQSTDATRIDARTRALGRAAGMMRLAEAQTDPRLREAVAHLLVALPLGDLVEHAELIVPSARLALEAREHFPWGARLGDDLFRHFVLPPRVNNEALDSVRAVLLPIFRERLRGLTMREAALEINRWCHEHVTYRPTDARTSSPLATIRAGFGRCGEESTLLTAALRAAALPARQCYTPRWAHSDDNHAWVEVWVDGAWHFMGACEPEPDLDLAWFAGPATRAMLVATNVPGEYPGPEPVLAATGWTTRINLLATYAPVRTLTARVRDAAGRAVEGVHVDFRLYNYAELYPLTSARSDARGEARFSTGLGDLVVWVRHNGMMDFAAVNVATTDSVTLVLAPLDRADASVALDLVPPVARGATHTYTGDRSEHERRNRRGDSLRAAYVATFIDSAAAVAFARAHDLDADSVRGFLTAAGGNGSVVRDFLAAHARSARAGILPFLSTLTAKDLRDITADGLAHCAVAMRTTASGGAIDAETWRRFVLAPRVGLEPLVEWRRALRAAFGVPADAPAARVPALASILAWVRDSIALDSVQNWSRVPITPRAVLAARTADRGSRDILLVAACRALGIPARLDGATGVPEVLQEGRWVRPLDTDVATAPRTTGSLALRAPAGTDAVRPEYATHYTIARIDDGAIRTLDYEGDAALAALPAVLELDTGRYMLTTGVRQSDGSVRALLRFFRIAAGARTDLEVTLRNEPVPAVVLGRLDAAALAALRAVVRAHADSVRSTGAADASGGSNTAGTSNAAGTPVPTGMIVIWARSNHEPSRHVFGDLARLRTAFDAARTPVVIVDQAGGRTGDIRRTHGAELPAATVFAPADAALRSAAAAIAGGDDPIVLHVRADGSVTGASSGYRIGIGEQLLRTIAQDN